MSFYVPYKAPPELIRKAGQGSATIFFTLSSNISNLVVSRPLLLNYSILTCSWPHEAPLAFGIPRLCYLACSRWAEKLPKKTKSLPFSAKQEQPQPLLMRGGQIASVKIYVELLTYIALVNAK